MQAPESPEVEGVSPLRIVQKAIRLWWVIAITAILGGIIGWSAHFLTPPEYETTVSFSFNIDLAETGALTQYEEDLIMNAPGDVLFSPEVVSEVASRASQQGVTIRPEVLRNNAFIERQFSIWRVRIRNRDPKTAALLSSTWGNVASDLLQQSMQHVYRARQYKNYLDSLASCLERSVFTPPIQAECASSRLADLQTELNQSGQLYAQEKQASLGLLDGLLIGPWEASAIPTTPVLFNTNQQVLAGCLLGILMGIFFVQTNLFGRLPG